MRSEACPLSGQGNNSFHRRSVECGKRAVRAPHYNQIARTRASRDGVATTQALDRYGRNRVYETNRESCHDSERTDGVGEAPAGGQARPTNASPLDRSHTYEVPAKRIASSQAIERAEAEVIAVSLRHRLGAPLEINSCAQRPFPRLAEMSDVVAFRATTTPIVAGDHTVTGNVYIRFALGPELGG